MSKPFQRREKEKAKKDPRKISKSYWTAKAETMWVYEKLISTSKSNYLVAQ